MNKTWQIHGALALVGLIYGANYVIAKGVMPNYMSPNAFILLRATVATVLFWIYHAFTSSEKVERRKDYWLFAKCAVFGVMGNQLIFFNGLRNLMNFFHKVVSLISVIKSDFLMSAKISKYLVKLLINNQHFL
jgi:drug/metabolite transporter (DMT)-like permease